MATRVARLPGIRFQAEPPALADTLPRMDVAAFAGLAASGPPHVPVAVEDPARFADIFGQDLPLAWDDERGEQGYAYLAPAVRAFFRNGGQRCWVVRILDPNAWSNRFPVPGLAVARFDAAGAVTSVAPAFAPARSPGSWSDGLRVGAALASRPLAAFGFRQAGPTLLAGLATPGDLVPGDTVRLTFPGLDCQLVGSAASFAALGAAGAEVCSPLSPLDTVTNGLQATCVTLEHALWFATRLPDGSPPAYAQAEVELFSIGPSSPPAGLAGLLQAEAAPAEASTRVTALEWSIDAPQAPASGVQPGVQVTLDLPLPADQAPQPGNVIRVSWETQALWVQVQDVVPGQGCLSPGTETTCVRGQGVWWLAGPPAGVEGVRPVGERLSWELWVRRGDAYPVRLGGLGLAPGHPRYWGALPSDSWLFGPLPAEAPAAYAGPGGATLPGAALFAGTLDRVPETYARLWEDVSDPRFALAGPGETGVLYFPVAMPVMPAAYVGPLPAYETALDRDGLAAFSDQLFLDPQLADSGSETLLSEADFIRYQQPRPRALRGIHALLGIEEATLASVPDAVQRGWTYSEEAGLPPAPPVLPQEPQPCCEPPLPPAGEQGQFADVQALPAPALTVPGHVLEGVAFTASWPAAPVPATYLLQEAQRPDYGDAVTVYAGPEMSVELAGRGAGVFYYRAQAAAGGVHSLWSAGGPVVVAAAQPGRWVVSPTSGYAPDVLLDVQRALVTLCAARGELLAVLALPGHYRADDALDHTLRLAGLFPGRRDQVLSFGALYHPWLYGREETAAQDMRLVPPDGAACGLIARRTLRGGAWLAPANEPLRQTVALSPAIPPARRLDLQEGNANLFRQEPRGFLALSANTLSTDEDLGLISARRLLILLRRLALLEGTAFAFEPNSAAFRRQVQQSFASVLGDLYLRGAFAGDTAATAYRVDAGPELNTAQSVDQGRLIVEIRVAPARPLAFITVRLVETGQRRLLVQEG